MREIKFRFWDEVSKRMLQVDEMNNMWALSSGIHVVCQQNREPDIQVRITDPSHLMQFTGLTDKEGREIYEGDVVFKRVFNSAYGPSTCNGPVVMENGCFCIKNHGPLMPYLGNPDIVLEITGSIHENPELLEVSE